MPLMIQIILYIMYYIATRLGVSPEDLPQRIVWCRCCSLRYPNVYVKDLCHFTALVAVISGKLLTIGVDLIKNKFVTSEHVYGSRLLFL